MDNYMETSVKRRKFIAGLIKLGLTIETVNGYAFFGAVTPTDNIYTDKLYKLLGPDRASILEKESLKVDKCICGTTIQGKYFIAPTDDVMCENYLIIGSECVDQFVKNGKKKTCIICHQPTRNRIGDLCTACRTNYCIDCNKPKKRGFKKCWDCFNPRIISIEPKETKCTDCGKPSKGFEKCWACLNKNKEIEPTYCTDCNKPTNGFKKCYTCNQKNKEIEPKKGANCIDCNKPTKGFERCYTCNQKKNS